MGENKKNCVYCQCDITDNRAIDICDKCGYVYIGDKMFKTMKKNMDDSQKNGDLCHQNGFSSVNDFVVNQENKPF